ncbi:hypothetical protein SDC9_71995 [bioreactor metagenome]|uniref:Bacterial Pleckstrin homology domain-containing protein n=1 Tax=bioreactor metagenome TaxID=1076179 RepID=A0A644YAI5_9ZZZZ
MGREVFFNEDELVLKLIGITSIFALKREIRIPHKAIKNAFVDYFNAPRWMLKMPGTAIAPLNIYEGTFRYRNEWYFLSYEHKVPLVNLELDGNGRYKYIIFEIDNPQQVLTELNRQLIH